MGQRAGECIIWLEEQGYPLGEARRVILRELDISLNLDPGKSVQNCQCAPRNLDQISSNPNSNELMPHL